MKSLVALIAEETGTLLEIVNYNVESQQYVCAGTLHNLDILASATDALASAHMNNADLLALIKTHSAELSTKGEHVELRRGKATIPLAGIDVPFHSSFLHPQLPAFRENLLSNIEPSWVDPEKLIGNYIPNVTAEPFDITKESFERVYAVTKSERIKDILDRWDTEYAAVGVSSTVLKAQA